MYKITKITPNLSYTIHSNLNYSTAAYILNDIKKNYGRGNGTFSDRKTTLSCRDSGDLVTYRIIKI